MFKKKPQIKNLAPLRSSDRRKLADQIISQYSVPIPTAPSESNGTTASSQSAPENGTSTTSAPTLTSIRASLIPEVCLSARFTTHAGANAILVSGTVYVGAYAGQEDRILWIQYGKDSKLYPTVYTLWQNPGLLPLLHTQDFVVEKLRTGADLMTPGLVGGPPWPEMAKQGSVVAVAGLGKESVPVWIGVCKIDVSSLNRVQGTKGAAVEGVHWDGDEVWNWSQTGSGGRTVPERIEGWEVLTKTLGDQIQRLDIEDDDEDGQDDGGVAIAPPSKDMQDGKSTGLAVPEDDESPRDQEHEPTTAEIDQAFYEAFLYSIYDAKKNGSPPTYGIDLPIQPSALISGMIQPHLRFQSQHYTIKKTSWKNTKKFIKFLDKKQLVKSKDRNGGETVILDVDFNDQEIKDFQPYRLPKPKATTTAASTETDMNESHTDTSLNQKLTLQTLYRASSKLVPNLIPSKTAYYTAQQISGYLKTYVENNPELTTSTTSKRNIKLDPFIANNILGSNPSANDTKILAAGEIARDVLQKRILDDDHLCIPHWVLLRNSTGTYDPSNPSPSDPKPKSGAAPQVTLTLEKRTGTKTVTKISGLESFFVNPQILGPELQKKCAGSASVGQYVGGKPGTMEIVVQGDQRDVVERELGRRGVKKEWIAVVDKLKKKK